MRERMAEMSGRPEDPVFNRPRFGRLLRQANDAAIVDLEKTAKGFLVTLRADVAVPAAPEGRRPLRRPASPPRPRASAAAATGAAAAGRRAGRRAGGRAGAPRAGGAGRSPAPEVPAELRAGARRRRRPPRPAPSAR